MATITKTLYRPLREDGNMRILRIGPGVLDRADLLVVKSGWIHQYPLTWVLKSARIQLSTSAVVANRYISVGHYGPDGNQLLSLCLGPAVPASQAVALTLGPVGYLAGSATHGETGGYIGIGEGLRIQGDDSIRFVIDTNQAGDTWELTLQFKYETWSQEEWQKLTII